MTDASGITNVAGHERFIWNKAARRLKGSQRENKCQNYSESDD